MEKVLQCVRLPQNGKGTIGFNLKGEYLKKYGFQLGDKVKVEISKNKIVSPGCAGVKRSPPITLLAEGAGF